MRIFVMTVIAVLGMACSSRTAPLPVIEEARSQAEQNDAGDQQALDILGHRFVAAVKNDNVVAFGQSWLPSGFFPILFAQAPPEAQRPTPEQMEGLMGQLVARDQEIADYFPEVMKTFRGLSADLSGMELVSIEASINERDGIKQTSSFDLTVRIDEETTVQFYLDDGMFVSGAWYVTDTGLSTLTVSRGGESSSVIVGDEPEETGEQQEPDDQAALDILGHRFVNSLKDENMVAFSQCWLPAGLYPAMLQQIELPPNVEMPSEEQVAAMVAGMVSRDREVASSFAEVMDRLREISADLSGIELVSIAANISERDGVYQTSLFELRARIDEDTTVEIVLDDGMKIFGIWYLTDISVSVSRVQ